MIMPEQGEVRTIDRFFRTAKTIENTLANVLGVNKYTEYRHNRLAQFKERWQSAPFEVLSRDLTRYNLKMAVLDIGAIDLGILTIQAFVNYHDVAPVVSWAALGVGVPLASLVGMHGGFAEGIEEMALLKTAKERGFRLVIPIPWIAKIGNNQQPPIAA